MSCIGDISNRPATPQIRYKTEYRALWLGAYLLAASLLAVPTHSQISGAETSPDHTQIRGAQIIALGVKLSGDSLSDAFSGYVHYGTYILNSQNKVTASYSEYHYDDGRIDYTHSDGHNSQGNWVSVGRLICYRYHGGGSGGASCYEIYELDDCYYFFNGQGLYDGYSTRYKIGEEPGRGRAEDEPRCIPLIG